MRLLAGHRPRPAGPSPPSLDRDLDQDAAAEASTRPDRRPQSPVAERVFGFRALTLDIHYAYLGIRGAAPVWPQKMIPTRSCSTLRNESVMSNSGRNGAIAIAASLAASWMPKGNMRIS